MMFENAPIPILPEEVADYLQNFLYPNGFEFVGIAPCFGSDQWRLDLRHPDSTATIPIFLDGLKLRVLGKILEQFNKQVEDVTEMVRAAH
jgi:hypothetical protein